MSTLWYMQVATFQGGSRDSDGCFFFLCVCVCVQESVEKHTAGENMDQT